MFALRSSVSIPITLQRNAVLAVFDRRTSAFDEVTVEGLEAIAKDAEFACARLRAIQETEDALKGTISSLAYMTETRDPYTEGHQRRAGDLGAAIAAELGLDDALIELIRLGGALHDVGKIAVPAEILTRPGKLDQLEFEMVKGHTTLGADILTKARLPWPLADVALHHHERMDGSGYPHGLVGEAIALPTRIIAVADVVEAMAHHRPYRPALGLGEALAEVTAGAGTLYDARVVEGCLRVFERGFTFVADQFTKQAVID